MKLRDLTMPIYEAPLGDYGMIGNWGDKDKNNSFRHPVDRRLIASPKTVEITRKKLGHTDILMNLYFVNLPGLAKWPTIETGVVDHAFLMENMPDAWVAIQERQKQLGIDSKNAINVIYTNNSGSERVMMTPWVMIHRLGHALQASSTRNPSNLQQSIGPAWNAFTKEFDRMIYNIFSEVYNSKRYSDSGYGFDESTTPWWYTSNKLVLNFLKQIGTFRSARTGALSRPFEFVYELFAQYVTTGKITLNPFPTYVTSQRQGTLRYDPNNEEAAKTADMYRRDMESYLGDYIDRVLHAAVGHWLVM